VAALGEVVVRCHGRADAVSHRWLVPSNVSAPECLLLDGAVLDDRDVRRDGGRADDEEQVFYRSLRRVARSDCVCGGDLAVVCSQTSYGIPSSFKHLLTIITAIKCYIYCLKPS